METIPFSKYLFNSFKSQSQQKTFFLFYKEQQEHPLRWCFYLLSDFHKQ